MDTLDPQAVNLAKAIRQTESGGNFSAKGKSREYGAYQFLPETWNAYSKEAGIDVPLEKATPQQQNEVAYKKIKKWKDQGLNVGQIASSWNAGPGKPNAYLENHVGTNEKGVNYDTPAYAKSVAEAYQQLKSQTPQDQTLTDQIKTLDLSGRPIDQGNPTVAGNIIRGLIKTPAKIATNLVQAGEVALGKPVTEPFTGSYLGRVEPVGGGLEGDTGRMIREGVGAGVETGLALSGGKLSSAGLKGLLGSSKALVAPEITNILEQSIGKGETIADLSRQEALDALGNRLKEMPVTEAGGKVEKLILKAIQELQPTSTEKQGLLKKLAKGGFNTAKNYLIIKGLGTTAGGLVNNLTK